MFYSLTTPGANHWRGPGVRFSLHC